MEAQITQDVIEKVARLLVYFAGFHRAAMRCSLRPTYTCLKEIEHICPRLVTSTKVMAAYEKIHTIIGDEVYGALLMRLDEPGQTIVTAAWNTMIRFDAQITDLLSGICFELTPIDEVRLCSIVDLCPKMVPIARVFTLWSLREISASCTPALQSKVNAATNTDECREHFKVIYLELGNVLHPITGQMGRAGGQSSLNKMIAQYTSSPPTRAEVINRLLQSYPASEYHPCCIIS